MSFFDDPNQKHKLQIIIIPRSDKKHFQIARSKSIGKSKMLEPTHSPNSMRKYNSLVQRPCPRTDNKYFGRDNKGQRALGQLTSLTATH